MIAHPARAYPFPRACSFSVDDLTGPTLFRVEPSGQVFQAWVRLVLLVVVQCCHVLSCSPLSAHVHDVERHRF